MCRLELCSGGSFSGKVGGAVDDLDLTKIRITLVKGVRMIVAIRRLAKDINLDNEQLGNLEREVREAAGEVQRVEKLRG